MRPSLALLAMLFWLLPATATATPWMIQHGYTSCSQCHVDPSGAGPMTDYGRAQAEVLVRSPTLAHSAELRARAPRSDALEAMRGIYHGSTTLAVGHALHEGALEAASGMPAWARASTSQTSSRAVGPSLERPKPKASEQEAGTSYTMQNGRTS